MSAKARLAGARARRGRDELLDVEEFFCLAEAQVVIGDWREEYNHRRARHERAGAVRPRVGSRQPIGSRSVRTSTGRVDGRAGPIAQPLPSLRPVSTNSHTRWTDSGVRYEHTLFERSVLVKIVCGCRATRWSGLADRSPRQRDFRQVDDIRVAGDESRQV